MSIEFSNKSKIGFDFVEEREAAQKERDKKHEDGIAERKRAKEEEKMAEMKRLEEMSKTSTSERIQTKSADVRQAYIMDKAKAAEEEKKR